MTDENLENHLRQLPTPELPEKWRTPILATARRASRPGRPAWPPLLLYLRHLFLRNPITATAMAALWLLIFAFKITTPIDPSSSQMLIAQADPHRPIYPLLIPEEVRLALLGQDEENSPPPRLRP